MCLFRILRLHQGQRIQLPERLYSRRRLSRDQIYLGFRLRQCLCPHPLQCLKYRRYRRLGRLRQGFRLYRSHLQQLP